MSCRRAKPKKSPPTNKSLKRKRPMKSSKPCINVVCKRPVSPRPFSANWKPCRSQVAPKQEVPFNPPGNHGAAQTTRNCFRQTRRNRIPRPRRQGWRKHPMAKEPLMVPAQKTNVHKLKRPSKHLESTKQPEVDQTLGTCLVLGAIAQKICVSRNTHQTACPPLHLRRLPPLQGRHVVASGARTR